MVNSKRALTATTLMGVFGIGWLIMPDFMGRYWRMAPGENLALSLYGALALGLNAWPPFVVELALTVGMAWALFVKPDPVV